MPGPTVCVKARESDMIKPRKLPLDELLKAAKNRPPMTPAEREAQRRSFVIGQLGCMAKYKDTPREELEAIYDRAIAGE